VARAINTEVMVAAIATVTIEPKNLSRMMVSPLAQPISMVAFFGIGR
jgi:hypothetical protein